MPQTTWPPVAQALRCCSCRPCCFRGPWETGSVCNVDPPVERRGQVQQHPPYQNEGARVGGAGGWGGCHGWALGERHRAQPSKPWDYTPKTTAVPPANYALHTLQDMRNKVICPAATPDGPQLEPMTVEACMGSFGTPRVGSPDALWTYVARVLPW